MRNVAKYSAPLFPKPAGGRQDDEILAELTVRLGSPRGTARLADRARAVLPNLLGPERTLDLMLRTGTYGAEYRGWLKGLTALPGFGGLRKLLSAPDRRPAGLSVAKLLAEKHGVDLGPLRPNLVRRLATPDKRIQLAPELYVRDLTRAVATLRSALPDLVLIGRRHVRSNNSWLHNSQRLVKGKPRCTLLMHPDDATRDATFRTVRWSDCGRAWGRCSWQPK